MKTKAATKAALAALAMSMVATTIPASAQPMSWNRETAWRGAPEGLQQRIDWLQQRIDRGRADGSLSRAEAQRAQRELEMLDRDADALDRRLDNLSRNIRWARGGGGGYDNRYGRNDYSTDYDAARYYRDDPRYTERRLSYQDEVYRGSDGRYYCKRSDGTTGLIVGAAGGALLGNVIDGGRSRVGGTLIGGALGALLGRSVDQQSSDYRCR
ncbi:MAG TPA: glycine zipper 2TM domain-containing protein [Novosphingobium sp.]